MSSKPIPPVVALSDVMQKAYQDGLTQAERVKLAHKHFPKEMEAHVAAQTTVNPTSQADDAKEFRIPPHIALSDEVQQGYKDGKTKAEVRKIAQKLMDAERKSPPEAPSPAVPVEPAAGLPAPEGAMTTEEAASSKKPTPHGRGHR